MPHLQFQDKIVFHLSANLQKIYHSQLFMHVLVFTLYNTKIKAVVSNFMLVILITSVDLQK